MRFLILLPGATSRQSRDLPLALIFRAFGADMFLFESGIESPASETFRTTLSSEYN